MKLAVSILSRFRQKVIKAGENWLLNADKHWKECAVCQKRIEEADHIYENEKDSACKICGYKEL